MAANQTGSDFSILILAFTYIMNIIYNIGTGRVTSVSLSSHALEGVLKEC